MRGGDDDVAQKRAGPRRPVVDDVNGRCSNTTFPLLLPLASVAATATERGAPAIFHFNFITYLLILIVIFGT